MSGLTISEILRGLEPGRMQCVGVMQMIPLVSEDSDDRFGTPEDIMVDTSNYGTMNFYNESGKPIIVPTHSAYIVDQAAQNHAMTHLGLIDKKTKKKTYNTAACIQQSQGGYIKRDKHKLMILPYSLRETALNKRNEVSYGKLWDAISNFNRSVGVTSTGHLELFINNFKDQLDEFVAEFELVDKQLGAIILINGQVVGFERAPSYDYWKSIFTPLIRECYGSMAIQSAMNEEIKFSSIPLDEEVESLSELMDNYFENKKLEEERTKEIIRNLLDDKFTEKKEKECVDSFETYTLENKQFKGQVVKDGARIKYASLITTQKFYKDASWFSKSKFTI